MPITDGGYPTVLIMKDSGCLCGKCATENKSLIVESMTDGYDRQWIPYALEIHYEGPSLYCDNCCTPIEPAYTEE
jgi:hypothetical protein